MHPHYHTLIQIALAALVVSGLSVLVWTMVNDGRDGLITGRVVSVATSTLTIADRHNDMTTVGVTASTEVREGREAVTFAAVTPEKFVQVRVVPSNEGALAESITILNPPGRNPSDHADK
ncbi:hypothetical protein KC887_05905 [Candidatus Kaiserbacteria bacterium]|nr:hypothetical protein [Candidatus Kaiserbacteria bacterium]